MRLNLWRLLRGTPRERVDRILGEWGPRHTPATRHNVYSRFFFILLFAALNYAPLLAGQEQPQIIQESTGWCSPNIANVSGKVTVICNGIDPGALDRLNKELNRKQLQLSEKIKEANQWATRYKELERQLAQVPGESELSQEAEKYLKQGDLENAGSVLDQLLAQEEAEVQMTAQHELERALVFELQFEPKRAIPYLEKSLKFSSGVLKVNAGLELSKVLLDENNFADAEPILVDTVSTAKHLSEGNPVGLTPFVVTALTNLGDLYAHTERDARAIEVLGEAKQDACPLSSMTQMTRDCAGALVALAITYSQMHLMDKAESNYKSAVEILRALAGPNCDRFGPELATSLHDLGNLYIDQRQFGDAHRNLDESLQIRQKLAAVNPAYQEGVANTLDSFANLYSEMGERHKAEDYYRKALSILQPIASKDPEAYEPQLALTLTNFGSLELDVHHLSESQTAHNDAVRFSRNLAARNEVAFLPFLARSLNNRATLYSHTQRPGKAENDLREALYYWRKLENINPHIYDYNLAQTLNNLGALLRDSDQSKKAQSEEAEADFQECLRVLEPSSGNKAGKEILLYIDSLDNLGMLYQQMRRFSDAETDILRAERLSRDHLEGDPFTYQPVLAQNLIDLGRLYGVVRRLREAHSAYEESVSIYRNMSAKESENYAPNLALVLNYLGDLDLDLHFLSDASTALDEALQRTRALATEFPDVFRPSLAVTLNSIGALAITTGRFSDAGNALHESLTIWEDLGKGDQRAHEWELSRTLENLAILGTHLNDLATAEHYAEQAAKIKEDFWKINCQRVGDELGNSLLLYTSVLLNQQKSPAPVCKISNEALLVAVEQQCKERAIEMQQTFCQSNTE